MTCPQRSKVEGEHWRPTRTRPEIGPDLPMSLRRAAACLGAVMMVLAGMAGTPPLSEARAQSPAPQTRCGWYANPGPASHYLFDRDGRWVIGEQGGPPARGFTNALPHLNRAPGYWVRENTGSYGYGCACLEVRASRFQMRIDDVLSARQQRLAVCRADRNLQRFER